jgi:hypothetical protein
VALSLMEALRLAMDPRTDPAEPRYLEACLALIRQRAKLRHRIWARLPNERDDDEGLWQYILDRGVPAREDCSAVFIEPSGIRQQFMASDAPPVTIQVGAPVHLKTRGSQNMTALERLHVLSGVPGLRDTLVQVLDPLVESNIIPMDWMRQRSLVRTAREVRESDPVIVRRGLASNELVPMFQIIAVDQSAPSVTIQLDRAMEEFTPTDEEAAHSKALVVVTYKEPEAGTGFRWSSN